MDVDAEGSPSLKAPVANRLVMCSDVQHASFTQRHNIVSGPIDELNVAAVWPGAVLSYCPVSKQTRRMIQCQTGEPFFIEAEKLAHVFRAVKRHVTVGQT